MGYFKLKKIIYYCKHGEAVSDWNITSEVDWLCSLTIDKVKQLNFYSSNYAVHLISYVQMCNCFNIAPIVNMFNIDEDYLNVGELPFMYSTHLIIDEIRARIAEGIINVNDVEIYVEDSKGEIHLKKLDEHGRTDDWFDTEYVLDDIFDRLF